MFIMTRHEAENTRSEFFYLKNRKLSILLQIKPLTNIEFTHHEYIHVKMFNCIKLKYKNRIYISEEKKESKEIVII